MKPEPEASHFGEAARLAVERLKRLGPIKAELVTRRNGDPRKVMLAVRPAPRALRFAPRASRPPALGAGQVLPDAAGARTE